MALHPILHINEQESMDLTGADDYINAARQLHNCTQNTVVITLGARGTYCLEQGGDAYHVPTVPVTHVKDTIGAGDAHVGTLLACLTKDIPMAQALAYANQVAGAVTGVSGSSLPPELLPPFPRK